DQDLVFRSRHSAVNQAGRPSDGTAYVKCSLHPRVDSWPGLVAAHGLLQGWYAGLAVPRCRLITGVTRQQEEEEFMRDQFGKAAAGWVLAVGCLVGTAHAQAPASGSVVVEKPTYVTIPMEITVNKP